MKVDKMLNAQVKELYETGNLDPIQIAEVLSLDEHSVKMVLISNSSAFRKAMKADKTLFTSSDLAKAKDRMSELMYSESDGVSFRASKFVINEAKGRHDVRSIQNVNINVNILNEQIANAKKAIDNAKNKIIDIPAEVSHLAE